MEGSGSTLMPVHKLVPCDWLSAASASCHSDKGLCHKTMTQAAAASCVCFLISVFLSILEGLFRVDIPRSHLTASCAVASVVCFLDDQCQPSEGLLVFGSHCCSSEFSMASVEGLLTLLEATVTCLAPKRQTVYGGQKNLSYRRW